VKQKNFAGLLIVAKNLAVVAQTAVYSVHVNVFIANQPIRIPVGPIIQKIVTKFWK
jgi:hypothetical protein